MLDLCKGGRDLWVHNHNPYTGIWHPTYSLVPNLIPGISTLLSGCSTEHP